MSVLADLQPSPLGTDYRVLGWAVVVILIWSGGLWILRRHKPAKRRKRRTEWLGGGRSSGRSRGRTRSTPAGNRGNPEPTPKRTPFAVELLHDFVNGMKEEAAKQREIRRTQQEVRSRDGRRNRGRN